MPNNARWNVRQTWLTVGVVAATAGLAAASPAQGSTAPVHSEWRTPWSYEGAANGADHWGDLDPLYAACKTGMEQSPIDIHGAHKANLAPLRFAYTSAPLAHFVNNGYTVRVNYPPGNGNALIVGDTRYELTQFHFHRPSEEYVDGKPSEMVIHLMHRSSDGRVVGVAVLVTEGNANATVEQLWAHMPRRAGEEENVPDIRINPAGLLPGDDAYYMYRGSLTAPPCSEGITWFVLKAPVTLAPDQIKAFADLYPHDVRPLQPLNGRVVEESAGGR
jgi:carbonic anhydrase